MSDDLIKKALIDDFDLCVWDEDGLLLLKPEHLQSLPENYMLTSISDKIAPKESVDLDTRNGYLAFGITKKQREELLEIMLNTIE